MTPTIDNENAPPGSVQRMVRMRISTIMKKASGIAFGIAYVGLATIAAGAISMSLGLDTSIVVLTFVFGSMLTAGGLGSAMTISAILWELQNGGLLERPNDRDQRPGPT